VRARHTSVAVGVALAIIAIAVARFARDHRGGVYDDAFICLRHVKNLDAGCGLRFNCGDPPVKASPARCTWRCSGLHVDYHRAA
jgi:hypothetical protein